MKETKTTPSMEKTNAIDFVKTISPTKDGVRQVIFNQGLLKHVHNWMEMYASIKVAEAIKENDIEIKRASFTCATIFS